MLVVWKYKNKMGKINHLKMVYIHYIIYIYLWDSISTYVGLYSKPYVTQGT